ncbi:MAG: hypothetical protein NVS2B7_35110 [Herpetosiphon sp.]
MIGMQPSGIITLTTDFGLGDGYVAMMHGAMLGIAPAARIVDFSHDVPPQQVASAAYLLWSGYRIFPPGTVHVVVVDPGVGTDRRAVAVSTGHEWLVGPDNGVFDWVLHERRTQGACIHVVELTDQRWWRSDVSATFHGRDIFGPVAAHLTRGVAFDSFGTVIPAPVQSAHTLPTPAAKDASGMVVHVDHFGNAITNLLAPQHMERGAWSVLVKDHCLPVVRTYGAVTPGTLCALVGSNGLLEVAVRDGSAAKTLGLTPGQAVSCRLAC